MQSPHPTPETCGACQCFEPARHEPPGAPKYGYCQHAGARLIYATQACFQVSPMGRTAFVLARKVRDEKNPHA
jgi:hypothetical protein